VNSGATARAGALLLALVSIGEMTVGVLLVLWPSVGTLLIGAPLEGAGLLVARMLGVAILVIGLTWWLARRETDRIARHAPGFILYNVGVGALFALAAMSASGPLVPWIVAIAHIASGAVFAVVVAMGPSRGTPPSP
jgi:hypothetical protein